MTDEHKKILDDMELSPSGLFKQKMEEVKQNSANYNEKLQAMQNAIVKLNAEIITRSEENETLKEKIQIMQEHHNKTYEKFKKDFPNYELERTTWD